MNSEPTMMMPVAPTGFMGNNGSGWGGDWWFIILFVILFCGWGGNWGNNGNNGVASDYVLATDFATIERKLDGVNNGICDSTFALNNTMTNGFANAELSRCNQQQNLMQQLFSMQMQSQECCCENRAAIAQVRYDMATQACDTRSTVTNAARDIIDNANCNTRSILDFLVQDKLRTLESENQSLKLAASQERQNNYLVSQLRPLPIPSYPSCNPWSTCCCTRTDTTTTT